MCAKPGTGKTWSSIQLSNALAARCAEPATEGVPLVPVLLYAQKFSRMLIHRPKDKPLDERVLLQCAWLRAPLITRDPLRRLSASQRHPHSTSLTRRDHTRGPKMRS